MINSIRWPNSKTQHFSSVGFLSRRHQHYNRRTQWRVSLIDEWFWIFPLKHSDLDDGVVFLEDFSVFLPFPQLDVQQLFEIEPLPSEDYDDFLHNLVARDDSSGGTQETRDSPKDNTEAEKRKRGRPPDKKSLMEKRREANNRERKRMRALVRLEEHLVLMSCNVMSCHVLP